MEAFLLQNKVQMVHVPFKGIAAAILDVSADRVDLAIGSVGSTSGSIKDGRLVGLAVSGAARHPAFPNVPTFAEAGFPSYKMVYWFGVMAPAGTPAPIVDRLQKEIAKAVTSQKVREVFGAAGVRPVSSTPGLPGAA
jgi:tripartite-type tricarboxylate transporter receptor subunit TctC